MCGRDRARRMVVLADPVFQDQESPVEMVDLDLVSRMALDIPGRVLMVEWRDLEILGPGLPVVCLRSVAARKAWPVHHRRGSVQTEWPSAGS